MCCTTYIFVVIEVKPGPHAAIFDNGCNFNYREKKKHYNSNLSYAIDDLQSEKRFLPKQYKKLKNELKNKVNQSFSQMKQKLGIKQKNWARGDGLHSIYSGSLFNLHHSEHALQTVDMNEVRSSILDTNQSMAFNALFTWGIFEGAELSILNELCSNATLVTRKKGQYLFKHDSPNANDFLYVLKSGTCSVIFPQAQASEEGQSRAAAAAVATETGTKSSSEQEAEDCGDGGDVVLDITAGRVVASVADVLAWLMRSGAPRRISLRCSEDCELVAIPSPRTASGQFQSRLHMTSFARIARMLLIRFNRTTNTTALFYLGLAEHMVPRVPAILVPTRLKEICDIASSGGKQALSSLDASMYPECLELIQNMIGSLLGIDASEVKLPTEHGGEREGSGGTTTESKQSQSTDGGDAEGGEGVSFIPPPVAYTRAKSLESVLESDAMLAGGGAFRSNTPIDVWCCCFRDTRNIFVF
jgi:hypothetical protein